MVYADENADHNAQCQEQKPSKQRPVDIGLDVDGSRKLGPSVAQWAAHEQAASLELPECCSCGNRFMPDSVFCRKCGIKRSEAPGVRAPRTSRQVAGSPGPLKRAAASTPDVRTTAGRTCAGTLAERRQFSPVKLDGDAVDDYISKQSSTEDGGQDTKVSWVKSLREPSPGPAWRAQTTKPQGPNLRTAQRSRSSSRGSQQAGMGTPRMTPRGRSSTPQPKSSDTQRTPKRKGRRSLSHWYAEGSAPARVTGSCHEIVTPKRRARSAEKGSPAESAPCTGGFDSEDGVSLHSVGSGSKGIGSAGELRSQMWQQIWIERRRNQLNEMSHERSTKSIHAPDFSTACCPPMQTKDLKTESVGECSWLRSLRQTRSESPAMHRTPSKRDPLNFATGRRARSRSTQRSASHTPERFSMTMTMSGHATPRERAALEKHVERAYAVLQAKAQDVARAQAPVPATQTEAHAAATSTPSEPVAGVDSLLSAVGTPQAEEWLRKAGSAQERAERARTLVEAKIGQVAAHERARVCVFKRTAAPATTSSTNSSE